MKKIIIIPFFLMLLASLLLSCEVMYKYHAPYVPMETSAQKGQTVITTHGGDDGWGMASSYALSDHVGVFGHLVSDMNFLDKQAYSFLYMAGAYYYGRISGDSIQGKIFTLSGGVRSGRQMIPYRKEDYSVEFSIFGYYVNPSIVYHYKRTDTGIGLRLSYFRFSDTVAQHFIEPVYHFKWGGSRTKIFMQGGVSFPVEPLKYSMLIERDYPFFLKVGVEYNLFGKPRKK